jgi:hypothetical protein
MTRNRFLTRPICPDIMPFAVTQKPPTKLTQGSLQVSPLHALTVHPFVYTLKSRILSADAGLFRRDNAAGQKELARVAKQPGQGQALTGLAHHLARAVDDRLKRPTAFEMGTFLHG